MIAATAIFVTYNVRDFARPDLVRHGRSVRTPLGFTKLTRLRFLMMATLSLRMRDDLKAKAQPLANEQGVSWNSHIDATLASTLAQAETLTRMGDRLSGIDRKPLPFES